MSIEAMKQALEVLEDFVDDPRCQKQIDDASIALRQAIAEAEKQEPVAYWDGNSKFALPKAKEWDKRTGGITAFGIDIPLYTHPQSKQPLTDEQIETMWHEYCKQWKKGEKIVIQFVDFARAIEVAHGIKE
jgi:hypothetical protein